MDHLAHVIIPKGTQPPPLTVNGLQALIDRLRISLAPLTDSITQFNQIVNELEREVAGVAVAADDAAAAADDSA